MSDTIGAGLFDDEHKAYRESVRTFLTRRVVPAYDAWRAAGAVPREVLRIMGADGFLGTQIPERHGGAGIDDPRFALIVAEEAMLAGAPALALTLLGHDHATVPALLRHGSDAQQERWLPGLASGDLLATLAEGAVTANEGADGISITGSAAFVVGGLQADVFVLVVGGGPDGSQGRRLALVERAAPGLAIEPSPPSIGLQAAGLADLCFDGVPASPVGVDARPFSELTAELGLGLAVSALAGARAALATTIAYVLDRRAFGQPIASFQNTRHALAATSSAIDAGRAFVEASIRERCAGPLSEARAAAVKLHCTELYGAAVDAGVQLHGGYGYIMEYPIAHAYADARFWRLHGGTSEAMKELIADSILR